MATCHDCTHLYCCKYDRFFGVDDVENKCNYFKNKTDFAEIVRCRDCVYFEEGNYGRFECGRVDGLFIYPAENDFCSYGERKTHNHDRFL